MGFIDGTVSPPFRSSNRAVRSKHLEVEKLRTEQVYIYRRIYRRAVNQIFNQAV
jgi:hypothetical protein